ncbi:TPA: hypothetical protein DEP96_03690 [Candidatus Uhrbacteria bacterium]|nr:hypothetical protein [Candidatus Uhrbacteria bacterium]
MVGKLMPLQTELTREVRIGVAQAAEPDENVLQRTRSAGLIGQQVNAHGQQIARRKNWFRLRHGDS